MFTDRRFPMFYVWLLSLQALIVCSYARSEFDLRLCDVLNETLKGTKIDETITNGICNLLALRDLAEGANDDVKGCDTVELLDQNLNDACKSLPRHFDDFDECKKELRYYCVNRHTETIRLPEKCELL